MRTILSIPSDLLVHLLGFLSGTDLCNVSQVNRALNDIVRSPQLWKRVYETEFGGNAEADAVHDGSVQALYMALADCTRPGHPTAEVLPESSVSMAVPSSGGSAGFSVSFWLYLTADSKGKWRALFLRTDAALEARAPAVFISPDDCSLFLSTSTSHLNRSMVQTVVHRVMESLAPTLRGVVGGAPAHEIDLVRWHHIACVCDDRAVQLFVDGLLYQSSQDPVLLDTSHIDRVFVGRSPVGAIEGFSGLIHDLRCYNRAISRHHLAILARSPPPDPSGSYYEALQRDLEAEQAQVVHEDFGCDGCSMFPIQGLRYQCLSCRLSYDLCQVCMAREVFSPGRNAHTHQPSHTFRRLRKTITRENRILPVL